MATATLTSKGQVTIPKGIRDRLRLHCGDKLEVRVTGQGEVVLKPVARRGDEVFGRLSKLGQKVLSLAEMDAATQQRVKRTT